MVTEKLRSDQVSDLLRKVLSAADFELWRTTCAATAVRRQQLDVDQLI
jgi:hypothetical protein